MYFCLNASSVSFESEWYSRYKYTVRVRAFFVSENVGFVWNSVRVPGILNKVSAE